MEPHNRELDVPCQCMSYPVRFHYYTAIYNKIEIHTTVQSVLGATD